MVLAMQAQTAKPLGIGFPYIAALPADLYRPDLMDFVEVTPETICRQRITGSANEIEIVRDRMDSARCTCANLPIVIHGVELSIGSAHGWNDAYLKMLDEFQERWPFLWHSEHLGFQTIVGDDDSTLEVGFPLPLPATREAAEVVVGRTTAILNRYGVPFLLENPAHYFFDFISDPELGDDIGLMRAIAECSGCHLLLDLHNLYCNAVNHCFDPFLALDRMPLERVLEIHIAGGSWRDDFLMDAHDGRVPENVWKLLEYALPRTPNAAGVVFELLEDHAVRLGVRAIEETLRRARATWNAYRTH